MLLPKTHSVIAPLRCIKKNNWHGTWELVKFAKTKRTSVKGKLTITQQTKPAMAKPATARNKSKSKLNNNHIMQLQITGLGKNVA